MPVELPENEAIRLYQTMLQIRKLEEKLFFLFSTRAMHITGFNVGMLGANGIMAAGIPPDENTLIRSVQKTGRLVVVSEDVSTCGVTAEIAAMVAEKPCTTWMRRSNA